MKHNVYRQQWELRIINIYFLYLILSTRIFQKKILTSIYIYIHIYVVLFYIMLYIYKYIEIRFMYINI